MTSQTSVLARPYATAAFEYAVSQNVLAEWEKFLIKAKELANTPSIQALLQKPGIASHLIAAVFCDFFSEEISPAMKNFLHLLSEKKRIALLPDIAAIYSDYYAEYKKRRTIKIISATELDESFKHALIQRLSKRLQSEVSIESEIDPSLLGGALIRAGDLVIDGTVRGKLNRLLESL